MCEPCANRPEMRNCSQCRIALHHENLSRNRALEELARKTLPAVELERTGSRRGARPASNRWRGQVVRRPQPGDTVEPLTMLPTSDFLVDRVVTFNQLDGSNLYDLDEWDQDSEFPDFEDNLASDTWLDLEDDDEDVVEDEAETPSLVISPSRSNSSYTYYNARLRPQIVSGRGRPQHQHQHQSTSGPRRGQRRRSPHTGPAPLQAAPFTRSHYRGLGRHRPPVTDDGWSPAGQPRYLR